MDVEYEADGGAPVCELCGLDLEFETVENDGHPAVSLRCLVHGERREWSPFGHEWSISNR